MARSHIYIYYVYIQLYNYIYRERDTTAIILQRLNNFCKGWQNFKKFETVGKPLEVPNDLFKLGQNTSQQFQHSCLND